MLRGGNAISSAFGGGTLNATLGMVVDSNTGATIFITAGHATGNPGDAVTLADGTPIGTVLSNPYRAAAGADIASVLVNFGVQSDAYSIQALVAFHVDTFDNPVAAQQVTLQGAASGTQNGTIILPNANVTDIGTGRVENGVAVADYASQAADSGAPVWGIDQDGDTAMLGFHGGRALVGGLNRAWFVRVEQAADVLNFQYPPPNASAAGSRRTKAHSE